MWVEILILVFFTYSQVCAETENQDEELRKIFDFLKRKYSLKTEDKDVRAELKVIPDIQVPQGNPATPELLKHQHLHDPGESIKVVDIPRPTYDPVKDMETIPPSEWMVRKQITSSDKPNFNGEDEPPKHEFHKLNQLPGCDYLLDILHGIAAAPIKNDIIDYFDQNNKIYAEGLVKNLRLVLEYSEDYDAVALLAARKVTKLIFMERLRCPATKFDVFAIQQMIRELSKLIHDEDDSMYDFLATMLYEIPNMEYSGFDPNYVAHEMTRQIHGLLFHDTIDYLLGSSMQDVEDFARSFYDELGQQLPFLLTLGDKMMTDDLQKMVYDNIRWTNVHCPSAYDVHRRHLKAAWHMTNGLKEIEAYELCIQIRNYMEKFVSLPIRASDSDVRNYDKVMKNICSYVRDYVTTIMTREQEYQKMVGDRDALALQEFFKHYLTEDELTVLAEVLEKLHWTPNVPVTEKPPLPGNFTGEVLPKHHVISNEQQDIAFWNSYLEALTIEAFENMSLTEFKESIRRWLREKQKRLESYHKYSTVDVQKGEQNSSATGEKEINKT